MFLGILLDKMVVDMVVGTYLELQQLSLDIQLDKKVLGTAEDTFVEVVPS